MIECRCQKLDKPLDAVAMGYRRENCVVVKNRSQRIIRLCSIGHVAEPFDLVLCNPEFPEVAANLNSGHLKIRMRFDDRANITSDL